MSHLAGRVDLLSYMGEEVRMSKEAVIVLYDTAGGGQLR